MIIAVPRKKMIVQPFYVHNIKGQIWNTFITRFNQSLLPCKIFKLYIVCDTVLQNQETWLYNFLYGYNIIYTVKFDEYC